MFEFSALRLVGVIFGLIAIVICFRRLRLYSEKRTDVWLLFAFGVVLLSVGLFPGLANFPSSMLRMGGYQWGRLLALLIFSNILLWFFVFYHRGRNESRYYQFDNLVRALTVADFLKNNAVDNITGSIIVLIPAYNEAENLKTVLSQIPERVKGQLVTVLVLDDGSDDNTADVAREKKALVASHPTNRGGGAALKTGYELVTYLDPVVVLTMDADGQHDPADIEKLVRPILADEADFVIGSRVLGECADYSRFRLLGVHVFSRLINFIVGTRITDCSSGYRAMRGSILDECLLLQEQYHTAEVIIEAAKRGFRITERPVTIACRLSGESKKGHDLKYGLFFLRTIIKTWLR